MTTDRDLERAAQRFADTVHADVSAQVRLAWALERDRLYAEIAELRAWQHDHDKYAGGSHDAASLRDELHAKLAELRDEVHALASELRTLTGAYMAHIRPDLHSAKVPE